MRAALLIFILVLGSEVVNAQILPAYGATRAGNTGFQFLKISPDAASAGVSGSCVASINDLGSYYWNPAGVCHADTQHWQAMLGATRYFAGVTGNYAALMHSVSKTTYVGAFINYFGSADMPVTTEFQPMGTGQTFKSYDMAAGISLARVLSDNFCFGINLKYLDESFAGMHATTGVADFGFQYDIGLANLRFGVCFSNFGLSAEPTGKVQTFTLHGYDTIHNYDKINVPAVFRLGVAWDAIKSKENTLTLMGQLNHPTDNSESVTLGCEYIWNKCLYARTGYGFGAGTTLYPSFGAGIKYKRRMNMIKLDYGFESVQYLGMVNRFSLSVALF